MKVEQSGSGFALPAVVAAALPAALPRLSPVGVRWLRAIWAMLAVLVLLIQIAGLVYVLFDAYRIKPAMRAVGFTTEFADSNAVSVRPLRADVSGAGVMPGARIRAIAGYRFDRQASHLAIGRALIAVPGDIVPISFENPDGRIVSTRISRTARAAVIVARSPLSIDLRMGLRLAFTLICSVSLLGSSVLLLLRRADDPEAALFGIGFLLIAAVVDPPLVFWLGTGAGWVIDVVSGIWWALLVIALAAFPDGRFSPTALRATLIVAPVLGLLLATNTMNDIAALALAIAVPLLLLTAQVIRYRSLEPGERRQQIKWAALGFAAGFTLAGVSLGMSQVDTDAWSPMPGMVWALGGLCLFNLAFAVMPLGLLVALARYRLWDVDRIITRSAAVAALTGLIVLLWALLSDVAKQIITAVLGEEHASLAVGIGALVAAGVFTPTQHLVLRWSERRFNPRRVDLKRLPERLKVWSTRCTPDEVAVRALDTVVRALHAPAGAVLMRTPTGMAVLASRGFEHQGEAARLDPDRPDTDEFVLPLEDDDGLGGWLILRAREDNSKFPRLDLAALAEMSAPLAQALHSSSHEHAEDRAVLSLIDEVHERLAKLERTPPSRA